MAAILPIDDFLAKIKTGNLVILDVRSEGEYLRGHVPGALNLPLLINEERVIVGTTYKQKGREEAVKTGFELVGPRFASIITAAEKMVPEKKIALYCWRGGMRSNIMAWLLNLAGFQVFLLKGGYKSYRNWAIEQFLLKKNIIIIGGKTGSGKTDLLMALKKNGEQVIDLEGLAHHKGSAFGALGQEPQHTNEHFENLLAWQWHLADSEKIVWMENESRSVGSNIIPAAVFEQMREAKVIEVLLDKEIRKKRIIDEYGIFPVDILAANTQKLAKRLGGMRLKHALACLEENDLQGWVDILLEYYDATYDYGSNQRNKEKVSGISLPGDMMEINARLILQFQNQHENL